MKWTATIKAILKEKGTTAARLLGVARATVAFHVRRIHEKLEVHSKTEAVSKALRSGLIR